MGKRVQRAVGSRLAEQDFWKFDVILLTIGDLGSTEEARRGFVRGETQRLVT